MTSTRLVAWTLALSFIVPVVRAEAAESAAPQRYALLVGVNSYTHLADLHFCENDMKSLREACLAAGFPEKNVTLMHKSSDRPELIPVRNHVLEQLKILLAGVQPDDLVLVAFSGHGVQRGGKDYFCTIDTKVEDPAATMVPAEEVVALLDASKARQKVLVIDACRNDPLPEGTKSVGGEALSTAFTRSVMSKDTASHGLVVMRSCDEKQVSVEDPQLQHGVFMNFVINGLLGHADANRDKQVTLMELHMYAEYETRNHVRTTRSMLQTPSLSGEFAGNYVMASVGERPLKLDLDLKPQSGETVSKGPSTFEMKLYDEAYALLQQGKTAEAVTSFETLVRVAEDEQLKKIARLKLAAAYMGIDPVAYIGKALEVHKAAGLDAMSIEIQADSANIMVGDKAVASVKAKQIVGITSAAEGEWYYVETVDGDRIADESKGYLYKTAFIKPEPKPAAATTTQAQVASNSNRNNSYGYGYGNNNNNYRYNNSGGGGGGYNGGDLSNYTRREVQSQLNPQDYHWADRGQVTELSKQVDQYYKLEASGASQTQLRAKQRELENKAQALERKQMRREAFFGR